MPGYHVHTLSTNRPEWVKLAAMDGLITEYTIHPLGHHHFLYRLKLNELEMICEWVGFNNHSGQLN